MRDGFHALALPVSTTRSASAPRGDTLAEAGTIIGAVPGAIVTRSHGGPRFRVTHKIIRGTRPLHITAVPNGNIYWGEYFDNRDRAEVHIYASADKGETWQVAHTFSAGDIRHVHNIVYDRWSDCVWILTGDEGSECKVMRATSDLRSFDTILCGHQHARAVAAIPAEDALYLSTDTPTEGNYVLRVERTGRMEKVADLESSSIFGCQTVDGMFFSTMAEPSPLNKTRTVTLVGAIARQNAGGQHLLSQHLGGKDWHVLARWRKDAFPMHYFQYGNAILPNGDNKTNLLAATTVAVKQDDHVTFLWETFSVPLLLLDKLNPPRAEAHLMSVAARLRYYRRILPAYLGTGSNQLSFWHDTPEINPQASLDHFGPYYMMFHEKAGYAGHHDAAGIPMLDYRGAIGKQYNPIAIAQWGLANYNLFYDTGSEFRWQRTRKPQTGWLRTWSRIHTACGSGTISLIGSIAQS